MIRTRLCDLLGIDYPIIQAAMGWIAGPALAAAVSNAGGLGIIGINAGLKSPIEDPDQAKEAHRKQIRQAKELTSRPFGMGLNAGPKAYITFADRYFELAIEEKVPAVMVSAGSPDIYTRKLQDHGIRVLHAVSTVDQARKAEKAGVDGVITQGYEGGGHVGPSEIPTLVLVPQVVDAVSVPVVAGGGIADGRGLVAALALGAVGCYVGTRFMATFECDAHANMKEAVVKAGDTSTIAIGRRLGIALMRQFNNEFARKYLELEFSGASEKELQGFVATGSRVAGAGRYAAAVVKGELEDSFAACGMAAGLIKDVASAGEVVRRIATEAESVMAELNKTIKKKQRAR